MSEFPSRAPSDPGDAIPIVITAADRYSPASLLDRLPDTIDFAPYMLTDSDTAAALWILSCFPHGERRVWDHVGPTSIDFDTIIDEVGWTSSERGLIAAAQLLAAQGWHSDFDLNNLAVSLDDERWDAFMEALRIRRAGLRGQR